MEYSSKLKQFGNGASERQIADTLSAAERSAERNRTDAVFRRCLSCIDLTSLHTTDSRESINRFVTRAVTMPQHFPGLPNVASVCVYPAFVETAGIAIGDSGMSITSVVGGFPSSQTYLEVKMLETSMAVENGADEVDVVISVGEFLNGEYDLMGNEIETLRNEIGDSTILKTILETGLLVKPERIHRAAIIAMLAGADFIKTSTGKSEISATPEAVAVMCHAARTFAQQTGRKVGIKVAGGVRTAEEAVTYYSIVEEVLGEEWLTPDLLRIGASSLANNLISAIEHNETPYF